MSIVRPPGPLNLLLSQLPATWDSIDAALASVGGGGAVTSVFGRTGTVVAVANDYTWAQINKTTSSLADITTRSASDLNSGVLPDLRFPSVLPAISGANLTNLNASNLASGTIPDARFPATLPAISGANLTSLNATNITSGTLADGRLSANVTLGGNSFTGTGSIVRATSPTLTTPALGVAVATSINKVSITAPATSATLTIADGKTLTVSNTITFAASSDGFTATIPATGTTALGAGTLTVLSSNSASGANHTHAVTASANPGAAASLLATDASGFLQLVRLGIATAPTQALEVAGNVFVNQATANLFLKDTSSGWQVASTTIITPQANNAIRSTSYTSGLIGWNISALGNAEFNNIDVRGAIHAALIVYNAIAATAGTLGVFKSAAKLRTDVTVPSSPTYGTTTATIEVVDPDGVAHASAQVFAVNDILRLKDGLTGDTWFKVSAASDQTTFWRYTAIIMAGTNNVTYRAGLGVADYGLSGQGFIVQTADQTNAPYLQMATHSATFTSNNSAGTLNLTPQLRIGNLNGSYGLAADTYGFAAGEYGVTGRSWVIVDPTNGVRIGNNTTTLTQIDASGNASFTGSITSSSGTIGGWNITTFSLTGGSGSTEVGMIQPGASSTAFYAGGDAATAPFRVTRTGALTATNATITGAITATSGSFTGSIMSTSGTIGGWTINSDSINNGTTYLASNYDIQAGAISWFGKSSSGFSGWFLRDSSGRSVSTLVGVSSHPFPSLSMNDGTRFRVVIGGLDFAWGSEGSVSSMGMKIWNSAGNLLAHFSDVANVIAGWTISDAKISSTGVDIISGSSAGLAFGTTPPTSASSGTGIWLDRTGLYGLLSSALQVKIDATTGAIAFAGQEATLDANGLTLFDIDNSLKVSNAVKWKSSGSTIALLQSAKIGSNDSRLRMATTSPDITGQGSLNIQALSSAGVGPQLVMISYGSSHGSFASKRVAALTDVDNGFLIINGGVSFDGNTIPASTVLELRSTTGAFLPPRMTTTQKNALTATDGMLLYDLSLSKLQVRAGGAWVDLH